MNTVDTINIGSRHVGDGETVVIDHTVLVFAISIRNNCDVNVIKKLIETRHEVVNIEELTGGMLTQFNLKFVLVEVRYSSSTVTSDTIERLVGQSCDVASVTELNHVKFVKKYGDSVSPEILNHFDRS